MKKLLLIAGVFALILSSCTPDLPVADQDKEQEVVFTSNDLKGMKGLYDCDNVAEFASIVLTYVDDNDDTQTISMDVPVFYVNDIMYTQAIKLPSGETGMDYTLTQFLLKDVDSVVVNAVPEIGSEYGEMVSVTLPLPITVSPFTKTEVPLSILCYSPETHDFFGFTWFRVNEEQITNKFFFGDFCTKFFADYANDPYYGAAGAMVDMKAIFELALYEFVDGDWNLVRTVDNQDETTPANSGHLLELIYPTDGVNDGDIFRIDIRIRVKVGAGFEFVDFGSWYFADESDTMYTNDGLTEGGFDFGTDKVYDFILGNCNANGTDFMFAPYMNLPSGVVGMQLSYPQTDSYFHATLSGIGTGFDITNGTWPAYCFDLANTINGNGSYNVHVYSTLYVNNLPTYMQNENWGAVNWLANNYTDFEGWTWQELQLALWMLEENGTSVYAGGNFNGLSGNVARVNAMVTQALANDDFMPMPGGWAAVVLEHSEGTQTIFTIVDP